MGTTAHGLISLAEVDFSQGTMIMIGNETDGLRRTFRYESDALITIPMARDAAASSLNVGCAASVVLYEVVRQRRG